MEEQGRLYDEDDPAQEPAPPEEGVAFEAAFSRLEQIVAQLEGGQASLEDSLRLFEEGVGLARLCRQRLDRAERRIRVLVEGEENDETRRIAAGLEAEIGVDGGDGDA